MLFRWLFWKVFLMALLLSLLFAFLLLIIQIVKLDQILFSLPLRDSLPFLFLWLFYHVSYLFPSTFYLAYAMNLFELKESKKFYVLQSFGIDPINLYTRTLFISLPLFLSISLALTLVKEDDVGYIRRHLTLKYYTHLLASVPSGTFYTFDPFTLYVERKREGVLEGVFFKFEEGMIFAKRARVERGVLVFEEGSLLTYANNRTFSTDFKIYRLNLGGVVLQKKEPPSLWFLPPLLNVFLPVFLMGFAYILTLRVQHYHRFSYAVVLVFIFHHLALLLLKQRL